MSTNFNTFPIVESVTISYTDEQTWPAYQEVVKKTEPKLKSNLIDKTKLVINCYENNNGPSAKKAKKSFKCEICDYSSSKKDNLKKHVANVHEKKKPFVCKICDKRFSEKARMTEHVKSVHEQKELIICELCDYTCFWKNSMMRHIADVHEKIKP